MIVVDTNIVAYLLLPGDHTEDARLVFKSDSAWTAPLLWRSEFRKVLASSLRRGHLSLTEAKEVMNIATELLEGGEYEVDSAQVLRLAADSKCSAYDCEFVALARDLGVPLVTGDRKIQRSFRENTVPLTAFGNLPARDT